MLDFTCIIYHLPKESGYSVSGWVVRFILPKEENISQDGDQRIDYYEF